MFTLNFLKNSLINSLNSNKNLLLVNTRSLQLFKKPNDSKKDDDEVEEESALKIAFDESEDVENSEERQQKIQRMCNKSGLREAHRNVLHNKMPYNQAESWIHQTLKYKRMMYGRYGEASGVDPRICFYTKTELAEKNEYERVAFPKTVQEMMAINEAEKREKLDKIRVREEQIAQNLQKLETWKRDLVAKKAKKEEEARAAKERKDRLIEEVRRHFGYTVHPKDERFKELLEKKEKEQRKAIKDAKKQQKEAKLMSKITEKSASKAEHQQKSED